MRVRQQQSRFRSPPAPRPTTSRTEPVSLVTPVPQLWTPRLISEMSIRWIIVDAPPSENILEMKGRDESGNIYVMRADIDNKGWKLTQTRGSTVPKIILVPTRAPRAKQNWTLDKEESAPGSRLTWRLADRVMTWIPTASTVRESTLQQRVERRVSILSPTLSPPPRKRGRSDSSQNKGCKCALGEACRRLRLKTKLPACQPRLAAYPKQSKVYGKRERQRRAKMRGLAVAQRKALGLPPDSPAGGRFSAVHWHPGYARKYPKGMGRKPVLLDPSEASGGEWWLVSGVGKRRW